MALDKNVRVNSIMSELQELSGGAACITIGVLQRKYFGISFEAARKKLAGVPHQPGGRYRIRDVAEKIVQTEIVD